MKKIPEKRFGKGTERKEARFRFRMGCFILGTGDEHKNYSLCVVCVVMDDDDEDGKRLAYL